MNTGKKYLAHSATEHNPEGQPLREHLENVAHLSALFSQPFGGDKDGRLCGLYHDIGKYSSAFQHRLEGSKKLVDHSSAGAMLLYQKKNVPVSMCIAGHHAGLADIGTRNDITDTYMARMNRVKTGDIEDFSAWKTEISDDIPEGYSSASYYYIKMLFSALTDADWLDTEAYFNDTPIEVPVSEFSVLKERLDKYITPWWNAETDINRRRCRILESAIKHGSEAPGLFTMTVPTGGGKTVSSMAFALNHAVCHKKRRIIYVIPYCSILEQTRSVFERIFGSESIIAHYSGAEYISPETEEGTQVFSAENWEAPIVLTTAVQFFESLFSSRPSKNRKLHNIVNSVVIFDEAQMLPVPFLRPCISWISQLVSTFGCSAVLCTATQPALDPLLHEFLPGERITELCPQPEQMYQDFRRVSYRDDGKVSDEELVSMIQNNHQALCIVNSRRQAQNIYRMLIDEPGIFHLSTMMTPHDRKTTIRTIRQLLKEGKPCRVISTSLIEAGVDVDFPVVYRAISGLDSIIQAGGRCNREGKRSATESTVHIFRTEAKAPRMLEQNITVTDSVIKQYELLDSPEAIREYFQKLFYLVKGKEQLDERDILSCTEKLMFRTVDERFRMIDGAEYTIYVPLGEGKMLTEELLNNGPNRQLMRKLGEFSVSLYRDFFLRLCEMGHIHRVSENAAVLENLDLYSSELGFPFEVSEQSEALFI